MSRTRYRFMSESEYPCFLTCTVVEWLPVFCRPAAVEIVLDSWRFLQSANRLTVFGYVVLENHLHLIAKAPNLSKEIGTFKSFTARRVIDFLETTGQTSCLALLRLFRAEWKPGQTHQLWQEGSHPQQITGDEMMLQKLEYMHNNPVKRGYVDDPIHWRYSSARNYAGMPGLLDVVTQWQ